MAMTPKGVCSSAGQGMLLWHTCVFL